MNHLHVKRMKHTAQVLKYWISPIQYRKRKLSEGRKREDEWKISFKQD